MSKVIYIPPPALERLYLHFKKNTISMFHACSIVAQKLNSQWTPKHIYDILKGYSPATHVFKQKIAQLDYKTFTNFFG